jgi:hypothetical protein
LNRLWTKVTGNPVGAEARLEAIVEAPLCRPNIMTTLEAGV